MARIQIVPGNGFALKAAEGRCDATLACTARRFARSRCVRLRASVLECGGPPPLGKTGRSLQLESASGFISAGSPCPVKAGKR